MADSLNSSSSSSSSSDRPHEKRENTSNNIQPDNQASKHPDNQASKRTVSPRSKSPESPRSKSPVSPRSKSPESPRSKSRDSPASKHPDNQASKHPVSPRSKSPENPRFKRPVSPRSKSPDSPASKRPDRRAPKRTDSPESEPPSSPQESLEEKRGDFKQSRGVFSLLAIQPDLPTPRKPKKDKNEPEWVKVQRKTFMMWANSHLERRGRPPMTNLEEDMRDGLAFIALLESLSGKDIGMRYHKEPKTRLQMLDNVQVAFTFMETEGIEHVSMNPNDLVDGNPKLLLGILWRFIFKYHISASLKKRQVNITTPTQGPAMSSKGGGVEATNIAVVESEMTAGKILLAWFQASLPQCHITNFTTDWNDGMKLSALVNYCKPGLIPNWEEKDPENAAENIQNAINLANEHFNIPQVIHAEDLAVEKPDSRIVMTYLSYFCCAGSPGEKILKEWISVVMPETNITNFTDNWKDGEALCSLIAAFAPSALSLDDLELNADLENTRIGLQVAQQQFGILPLFSPDEFISPNIDQLSVMAYLTNFRYIQEERRKLPYLSAIGSGITGTQVGEEAEFHIEGEELDENMVQIRVVSPELGVVKVEGIPSRSGTPSFQYRPTVPGNYTVEIKYSGEHVRGSPYQVRHLPSLDSVTDGRGLYRACVGKEAEFTVDISQLGEGILNLRVVNPDNDPLDDVVMEREEEEGVYHITYTPLVIGVHTIDLEWDCNPDSDEGNADESLTTLKSSYTVTVFDASKCIVVGGGLTQAVIGKPAYFQINTQATGKGSLSAFLNGPGNPDLILVSIVDDVYSYEYLPTEGTFEFDITWEMVPIPGSPFKVTPAADTPAAQCIVKEKPVNTIRVTKPVSIIVNTPGASCQLKARLVGPRTDKECDVSSIDTNDYAVTAFPIEVGAYELHITYGERPIPDSPVHFNVNDPTKCWVVNPEALATGSWQCGQQVLVRVSTEKAGKGLLVGKVRGPTQGVDSETVVEEEGNQLVCFTPTETGQHMIDFFFDGKTFQEDTSKITVEDDNLEGIAITKPVSQTGYHLANEMLDIRMLAPGRDQKLFTVDAKGSQTGAIPTCELVPTGEDAYIIHFTAPQPDDYRVAVHYNGKSIPGSPFTLAFRMPPCPEKVEYFDPVLPFRAGGDAIELLFNVKQAGVGTLTANVTDSSSDDWFQQVNVEEECQDLFRVSFVPPKSDSYTVTVCWSGQPVPGSPFTIDYIEQLAEPSVNIEFEPDMGGPGKLTVTADGATCGRVVANVRQFQRGRYQISFLPPTPEVFDLRVLWCENEIKGSPFKVDLTPSPPTKLPTGVRIVSLPVSLERSGVFSAFAVDSQSSLVQPLKLSVVRKKDYIHVHFTDRKQDSYRLYLFWNKTLVRGSPFKIDLSA